MIFSACQARQLTHDEKGAPRITDDPPLIYHGEEERHPEFWVNVRRTLQRYREACTRTTASASSSANA